MGGQLTALMWACPYCRAPIGTLCVTAKGARATVLHVQRYAQAGRLIDASA